ncbi:hypothetical protein STRIP9103_01237 [Streptomyces ipomoeae 91-03]|uniref:Uncharacterized protein n=1 Tax=Streptomyces ipomoeae 91-03 TaxID=698759 RepID=L1KRG4_9ACTN|nr:hypothetical protein STRIP9103_01237 [Streptomyces ipomoeae 91-03]
MRFKPQISVVTLVLVLPPIEVADELVKAGYRFHGCLVDLVSDLVRLVLLDQRAYCRASLRRVFQHLSV